MRLHEHPDFAAFVTATATETDLAEAFIEKDYWITEILRVVATTLPDRAIFKGGTSLSKGWGLLDRFSEDIDLFIDPAVYPPLAKRAIDRALKKLRDDVAAIDGLELLETNTIGGLGRMDTFGYRSTFSSVAGLPPTVRLEPGVQSGKAPTQDVQISSLVAELLHKRGVVANLPGVDGLDAFKMTLLHFRRTFLEAGDVVGSIEPPALLPARDEVGRYWRDHGDKGRRSNRRKPPRAEPPQVFFKSIIWSGARGLHVPTPMSAGVKASRPLSLWNT